MFTCNAPPKEDVLHDRAHPDCSVVKECAPYLPLGATRSCVHISSRPVTHSRGERVLSWGQHLCSPAKKARRALRGQAAVQHSVLCVASLQTGWEGPGDEPRRCESWWRKGTSNNLERSYICFVAPVEILHSGEQYIITIHNNTLIFRYWNAETRDLEQVGFKTIPLKTNN